MIFEYGKVKGLKGSVVVVKEQKKIKAIYPFLCEKMGLDFCISYVGSIWGKPKAARVVGTLMRKNSFPIVVPCHRVFARSGTEHFSITCFNKRPNVCANKTQKSLCECAKRIKLALRDIENE